MASHTAKEIHDAALQQEWDNIQEILRSQPLLVNEKYNDMTLLLLLVKRSAPEDLVVESLHSASPDCVDELYDEGYQPEFPCILHLLADRGYAEALCRALQKSATRVNFQNRYGGNTPLHVLLKEKHSFRVHQEAACSLIIARAKTDVENEDGQTPAELYTLNECSKYDDTTKKEQKKRVLQLLHRSCINTQTIHMLIKGEEHTLPTVIQKLKAMEEEMKTMQQSVTVQLLEKQVSSLQTQLNAANMKIIIIGTVGLLGLLLLKNAK